MLNPVHRGRDDVLPIYFGEYGCADDEAALRDIMMHCCSLAPCICQLALSGRG